MRVKQDVSQENRESISRKRIDWDRALIILAVLAALAIFSGVYYKRSASIVSDANTDDIAQVARNISEGQGFTTRFVRPFYATFPASEQGKSPELNNGPLYPYALVAMFRLQEISDQVVVRTSLVFLILTVIATWLLGTALFDSRTGLLAAAVFGTSASVLGAGVSGNQWTFAALIFTLMLTVASRFRVCSEDGRERACGVCSFFAGVMAGLLYLISYSMIFLALPVLGYVALNSRRRWPCAGLCLAGLVLVSGLWAWRNAELTGVPFLGAVAWDVLAHSSLYPGDALYRTSDSNLHNPGAVLAFPIRHFSAFMQKLSEGSVGALRELMLFLGLAVLPMAVTSALYSFKSPIVNSIRGLLYILAVVSIGVTALFGLDSRAVIILAPAAAIFGTAYFGLIIKAKKLPHQYGKALVGLFIIVTAAPALVSIIWPDSGKQPDMLANTFFASNASRANPGSIIYTDVPWVAAWRTQLVAVLLPLQDSDVYMLNGAGYPMRTIILTPRSAEYPDDEIWYTLYKVRLWRDYVSDPKSGLAKIISAANISSKDTDMAKKYLQRLQRGFAISGTIAGFRAEKADPLSTDDIQILQVPPVR